MAEPEKLTIKARSGRWSMTFRVDPTVRPPTPDEAEALGMEIAAALLAAFGVDDTDTEGIEVPA